MQTRGHVKSTIPKTRLRVVPQSAKRPDERNRAIDSEGVSSSPIFSLPACLFGELLRILMETNVTIAGALLSMESERKEERNKEGTWSGLVWRMKGGLSTIKRMSVWVSVKNGEEGWFAGSGLFDGKIGEIAIYDNWDNTEKVNETRKKCVKLKIKKLTVFCIAPEVGMERIGVVGGGKFGRGPMGYDRKRKAGVIGGTETFLRMVTQGGLEVEELKVVSQIERELLKEEANMWYGSCSRNGETATAWEIAAFFAGMWSQVTKGNSWYKLLTVVNCKAIKTGSRGILMKYTQPVGNVQSLMYTVCHAAVDCTLDRTRHFHEELLNLNAFARQRDGQMNHVIGPVGCEFGLSSDCTGEVVLRLPHAELATKVSAETLRITLRSDDKAVGRIGMWKCFPLKYAHKLREDLSGDWYLPLVVPSEQAKTTADESAMPRVYDSAFSVEWRGDAGISGPRRLYELYLI
jgi:hypothetical protein